MNTINHNRQQNLKRMIMRRILYAYMLSVLWSRNTAWGFLFGASVIGFWRLVSITSIVQNFLQVRIGDVPQYVWHALVQAETLALLAFGIIVFTVLSVGVKFTVPALRASKLSAA